MYTFQERASRWVQECFGHVLASDVRERSLRFVEEALELGQATGLTAEDAIKVLHRVYSRPTGNPLQELGGVNITYSALATALGYSTDFAGEEELIRCWVHIMKVREKNRKKREEEGLV